VLVVARDRDSVPSLNDLGKKPKTQTQQESGMRYQALATLSFSADFSLFEQSESVPGVSVRLPVAEQALHSCGQPAQGRY